MKKIDYTNRFDFSNLDLRKVANRLGYSDKDLPKEDEYVIYFYDEEENNKFFYAKFSKAGDCYNAFQEICINYENASHRRHSDLSVSFPRGCFELAENDEPCEDYGDLLLVWDGNILKVAAQIQNAEYYV